MKQIIVLPIYWKEDKNSDDPNVNKFKMTTVNFPATLINIITTPTPTTEISKHE